LAKIEESLLSGPVALRYRLERLWLSVSESVCFYRAMSALCPGQAPPCRVQTPLWGSIICGLFRDTLLFAPVQLQREWWFGDGAVRQAGTYQSGVANLGAVACWWWVSDNLANDPAAGRAGRGLRTPFRRLLAQIRGAPAQ